MGKSIREITKSPKARAPATGTPILVRAQDELLTAIDDWRRGEEDLPSRPEALRRLAELGLAGEMSRRPMPKKAAGKASALGRAAAPQGASAKRPARVSRNAKA